MPIDPQTKLTLFNAIASAGKTIYDIAQGTSKLEQKQQLMEVYDTLMSLKRGAGDLEDENRELKAKLRFNSDEFEFKNPLWFDRTHPERALCPKCFSKQIIAPVAEPCDNGVAVFRRCLSCDTAIEVGRSRKPEQGSGFYAPPDDDWMAR
jgi:hypothetical protein